MFFKSLKEFLQAKWIPVVGGLLGILLGMLLVPAITVILRNYQESGTPPEITENSGLIKKIKIFFTTKSYDTLMAEQRLERLHKLQEENKPALTGIDTAMKLTVEDLSKKPVQMAGSATNITPTMIVPGYLKK